MAKRTRTRMVTRVAKVREPRVQYNRPKLNKKVANPGDAAKILKGLIGSEDQEHFVVMTLDGASRVIQTEVVFKGTLNQSIVHPREIFKIAIENMAASIICGHNHPSGTCEPSREDIRITQRLKDAGKIIGIDVVDHIIIARGAGYYSFSNEGEI